MAKIWNMTILAAALAFVLAPPAVADTQVYGAFRVSTEKPDLAVMIGEIDADSDLDFLEMLAAHPEIRVLALHSPGGDVVAGLAVARMVHSNGISTYVAASSLCYSACAYVFLAGSSRQMRGELGVHMPKPLLDLPGARVEFEMAIRGVLVDFEVPIWVYDGILNTPNDQLRLFSAAEAVSIGLNR